MQHRRQYDHQQNRQPYPGQITEKRSQIDSRYDGFPKRGQKKTTVAVATIIAVLVVITVIVVLFTALGAATNKAGYQGRVEQLASDDVQIARKWLISLDNSPYDLARPEEKHEIEQLYLCYEPEIRARCYDNGVSYTMTIKDNDRSNGIIRDTNDYKIDNQKYENMLENKIGSIIRKTRYQFYDEGQVVIIDVFHGGLEGLAYMEVEFANEDEAAAYKQPIWAIREVTGDPRYKNSSLAQNGWPSEDGKNTSSNTENENENKTN